MYYRIYKDNQKLWRWSLKAANHETIAVSSESYHNESDCLYAIGLVMDTNRSTPVYKE